MGQAVKGIITIEGLEIPITNPDKPLWPEAGITKALYLRKLAVLAPFLLKYSHNRLLTVIRWPHGIHGDFFTRKMPRSPVQTTSRLSCMTALNIWCLVRYRNCYGSAIRPRWSFIPPCIRRAARYRVNG